LNEVLNKNKELSDRLQALEDERKAETEKRLAEQNQWKELAEKRAADLADAQGKVAKLSDYEKTLEKLLATEVEQIPETKRGLVPDEMTTLQRLNWIAKNKALLVAPQPFDIGAGKQGGGENNLNSLTAEEIEIAKRFGVKPEDYAKNKFK
jgi:phage I-like protein